MQLTHGAVLRLIQQELQSQLTAVGASASRCSVVDDPGLQLSSDLMIQIKPLSRINDLPNVGIGLITATFEVVTWVRELKEAAGKSSLAISGSVNRSLLNMVGVALTALNGSESGGNTLSGALVVPIRFVSVGAVRRDEKAPGFIGQGHIFTCSYDPDDSALGMSASSYFVLSATAPTDLSAATVGNIGQTTLVERVPTTEVYIWLLSGVSGLVVRSNLGVIPFYSPTDLPPSGPTCTTVTIEGNQFLQYRSPYTTFATSIALSASRT